jgi:leader peptidase (prepilin peptidase)/N-methyltransferase
VDAVAEAEGAVAPKERSPGFADLSPADRWVAIAIAIACAAAALSHFGVNARGLISVAFVVALVVLAAVDLRYRVIPNRVVAPAAAAILLAQLAFFPGDAVEWILAGLGAGLIMLLPALVKPGSVGIGDAKLCVLLGVGLGQAVLGALLIGSLAAVPAALAILIRKGTDARKEAIPLGPFLAFGGVVALLLAGSL